jgi:integrase
VKRNLHQAVDFYLETRRGFGFTLAKEEVELHGLVRYAEQIGHRGPPTAALVIQWAQQPQHCQRAYWAVRLNIARRFAQFWQAYEPRTEVPPPDCFGPLGGRPAVHIYTPQEIGRLLEAATDLGCFHPLRGWTFRTLIGLLDCTGLRIGEALGLVDSDIDWSASLLRIHRAKYGRARLVPVQPSTLEALQCYRTRRDQTLGRGSAPRFFVTFGGRPLGYFGVSLAFRKLCRRLGWTHPPVPRLHDLRHYSESRIIPSGV